MDAQHARTGHAEPETSRLGSLAWPSFASETRKLDLQAPIEEKTPNPKSIYHSLTGGTAEETRKQYSRALQALPHDEVAMASS